MYYSIQQGKTENRNITDPSHPSGQKDLHPFILAVSFVVSIRIIFRVSLVEEIELQINVKCYFKKQPFNV